MSVQDLQSRQHDALIDSVEAMLRPMVPLFLSFGVTYAELADMVRGVFVKAVADQLSKEGQPVSASRLSLMTGVNRSLVERLLQDRLAAFVRRREADEHRLAISNVLALWHDDSRFSTLYGLPLDLATSEEGSGRKFSELVNAVCPGVDPRLLADELVVAGCAIYTDKDLLRCTHRTFIPSVLDPLAIAQIGQTTGTLTSTMIHNLTRDESEPTYFGRSIFSDYGISAAGFKEFLNYLNTEGQSFLEKADRWMNGEHRLEPDSSGKRVGLYLYVYDMPQSGQLVEQKTAASSN
ncbi:MAG: DUF6502 family protein [Steroidobacteraceae bacterium]